MSEYLVDSKVLGEKIRVVSDDQVVKYDQSEFIVYTESEVQLMAGRKPSDDLLRQIHLVKQVFPGATVIP